jgi:hypothetical protein
VYDVRLVQRKESTDAPLIPVQAPAAQLQPEPPLQKLLPPLFQPSHTDPVPHCESLVHTHFDPVQYPPAAVQSEIDRLEQPNESAPEVSRLLHVEPVPHIDDEEHSQSLFRVPPDESQVAPPLQTPTVVGAWPSWPTSQHPIPSVAPQVSFALHDPDARHCPVA